MFILQRPASKGYFLRYISAYEKYLGDFSPVGEKLAFALTVAVPNLGFKLKTPQQGIIHN